MPYDERVIEPMLWEIKQLRQEMGALRADVAKAFQLIYDEYDKMVDEDDYNDFSSKYGEKIGGLQSQLSAMPLDAIKGADINVDMLDPEKGMRGMWEYMKGKRGSEGFDEAATVDQIIADLTAVIQAKTGAPEPVAEKIAEEIVEDAGAVGVSEEVEDPHKYFEMVTAAEDAPSPYDEKE